AAGALRNIPGKHEGEEDTVHGRRHSFVEQLQHAVREVVNLRRVSVTSGSTQPASPKTAAPTTAGKSKPHAAKKQAAAKIDFDLAELLKDPDKQAMLDRFCVTDGPGGFTQAETERMKAAFQRFKPEGGTEIDAIDDLEKILIHLGYLKVLPDVRGLPLTRLASFSLQLVLVLSTCTISCPAAATCTVLSDPSQLSTLCKAESTNGSFGGDYEVGSRDHAVRYIGPYGKSPNLQEYLRFMSSYAQYERDEALDGHAMAARCFFTAVTMDGIGSMYRLR
ncbi:unnamed protein product, partial [Polarella glacialis]